MFDELVCQALPIMVSEEAVTTSGMRPGVRLGFISFLRTARAPQKEAEQSWE